MNQNQTWLIFNRINKKSGNKFAIILLLITCTYGIFQARILIQGPSLTVFSPLPGETITTKLIEITGNTKNVNNVSVNGKIITMNTDGAFSEKMITPNGYGYILIEAKNRFGHTTKKRIKFVGKIQNNSS